MTRADWLRLLGFYALIVATLTPWLFVLRAIAHNLGR
jgi:hypothetical protein